MIKRKKGGLETDFTVCVTGLLSSLGVRGSWWLVSAVSESCSDTVTNQTAAH